MIDRQLKREPFGRGRCHDLEFPVEPIAKILRLGRILIGRPMLWHNGQLDDAGTKEFPVSGQGC